MSSAFSIVDTSYNPVSVEKEDNANACADESSWFAVWTRSRQEKVAASILEKVGVSYFLPLKSEIRQWSDRKQTVTVPLFTGYLFVRVNLAKDTRLRVLKTPGIAGFVGNSVGPSPIPDHQINDIRRVLDQRVEFTEVPFLNVGEFVRVVRGPLAGVQGRLMRHNSPSRLVISVGMMNKAIAVHVSRQDIEPLN